MFILKREDVDIINIKHPQEDRKIPILRYNGETFHLINIFPIDKEEEAVSFWRDLTDNQSKFCILLTEKERFSIWSHNKVNNSISQEEKHKEKITLLTQACLLLLQTVYLDIEDLLGTRQSHLFIEDITKIFREWHFPKTDSQEYIKHLFQFNPLEDTGIPPWKEHHLITLLQDLYRLAKEYFGNNNFAQGIEDILEDLPSDEQQIFLNWLNSTPLGKLWH